MLRVAVVRSLLLCLLWISALEPLPSGTYTIDGFRLVTSIRDLSVALDTMLYTPSSDQLQSCPNSTFRCLKEEMKMLLDEINPKKKRLRGILRILGSQASSQQDDVDCLSCERYEEKSAKEFLDFVYFALQEANAKSLVRRRAAPS